MHFLAIFDYFPADDMKLFSELEVFSSQIRFVENLVGVLHWVKYSVGDYLGQTEIVRFIFRASPNPTISIQYFN